MTTTNEKVILSVTLDYANALQETAELATQIKLAKDQLKLMKEAGKEGTAEFEAQQQALRFLTDQYRMESKAIQDSVKAQQAATGSIQEMRSQINTLTKEYVMLSKEERESAKGKELLNKLRTTTDEVKDLEKAMGDNRRNVGNYASAFDGLVERLGGSTNIIGDARDGFNALGDVFKGSGDKFASFNGVLKASVIGIIITLVAGLVAAFLKFEPLMDKVKAVTAAANAVFEVFIERLTRVGRGLVEILSGNFAEGIDNIRNSFDGMAQQMKETAGAAYELSEAMDALEDRQRAQNILNAEANKEVTKLLLQSKNRTLAEKDRLALLDQASKIEKANFEQNKKIAEDEYNLALRNAKLKTQLSEQEIEELLTNTDRREELEKRIGTLSGKELDKLAELKAKTITLEQESVNLQEKIVNRRDALIQQSQEKAQKAREALLKLEEETLKAQLEADKKFQESITKEGEELAKKREQAYNSANIILRRTFADADIARLEQLQKGLITEEEFANQQLVAKQAQLEAQIELERSYYNDTIDLEVQLAETKTAIALKQLEDKKAIDDARIAQEEQTVQAFTALTNAMSDLAGRNTSAGKALAITSATISTFFTAQKAYESAFLPVPTVASPALGAISAAAAIATGLANVSKIAGVNIGGAAAGGGNFLTKGPTLLLVGDNPGGVERVTVEPLSGRGQTTVSPGGNLVAMAGGGSLTTFGGYAERNSGLDSLIDYDELAKAFSKQPAPILKITELNKVEEDVASLVNVSDL